MTDVLTKKQRSRCMSKIRPRNTKPELLLRKKLWSIGLRYRLKSELIGKPDIVFISKKIAIFIDGCFWHGCPEHYSRPKSNIDFWSEKIRKNIKRDKYVNDVLKSQGWLVLRFWEHEIIQRIDECVEIVLQCYHSK